MAWHLTDQMNLLVRLTNKGVEKGILKGCVRERVFKGRCEGVGGCEGGLRVWESEGLVRSSKIIPGYVDFPNSRPAPRPRKILFVDQSYFELRYYSN